MNRYVLCSFMLFLTVRASAIQQMVPDKDYCNKRKKNLDRLELKLSPGNKQAVVQEERRVYKLLLDDAKKELNQLQTIVNDEKKVVDWHRNKMRDKLNANQEVKKYLEKELDPKNSNNLIADQRQLVLQHIKALEYFLNETQDVNQKKNIEQSLDRNNHMLKLTDEQLLDIIVPPLRQELQKVNEEIEDSSEKQSNSALNAHAQDNKKQTLNQIQKNIESYQRYLEQTDEQIYDSLKSALSREINFTREMLEKYCK